MEIKQDNEVLENWKTRKIEFWDGASFVLVISTIYKNDRRRCIKRLTRLQEGNEVLMAESYINEIDLNGHEFSSFNPKNYIHKELFALGYLEKADFRNYESKED
jgi:hypothetical protein